MSLSQIDKLIFKRPLFLQQNLCFPMVCLRWTAAVSSPPTARRGSWTLCRRPSRRRQCRGLRLRCLLKNPKCGRRHRLPAPSASIARSSLNRRRTLQIITGFSSSSSSSSSIREERNHRQPLCLRPPSRRPLLSWHRDRCAIQV
jgi:hypothetical protein